MPGQKPNRLCFLIGPIGKDESETRNNADLLVEYVIKPVLEPMGYRVERADKIANPGTITDQVVNHVLDADLVVADLTSHNPNAFYELGLRHREDKPTIHMITKGDAIPFDVIDVRAIQYSLKNPATINQTKEELRLQAEAIEQAGYRVSNPITRARGIRQLTDSADSKERLLADLISEVRDLKNRVETAESIADLAWAATGGVPKTAGLGITAMDYPNSGIIGALARGLVDTHKPVTALGKALAEAENDERVRRVKALTKKSTDPKEAS